MGLISFTKASSLGNDFVIIDGREKACSLTTEQVCQLSNRRKGIGCDQIIVLCKPPRGQADVLLKFYNSDGSISSACGNGTRSVALFLMEKERRLTLTLQTGHSLCQARWSHTPSGNRAGEGRMISLTLGQPRFSWKEIPLAHPEALRQVSYEGQTPFMVNVGNPHAVFFVENVDSVPLNEIGPWIENHPAFPERVNAGFVQFVNAHTLYLKVWERGAGYTMACGTGACAAGIAAISKKLVFSTVQAPLHVVQGGGESLVHWQDGEDICLTGSAAIIFRGNVRI